MRFSVIYHTKNPLLTRSSIGITLACLEVRAKASSHPPRRKTMALLKITVAILVLAFAMTSCESTEVTLTDEETAMASAISPVLTIG